MHNVTMYNSMSHDHNDGWMTQFTIPCHMSTMMQSPRCWQMLLGSSPDALAVAAVASAAEAQMATPAALAVLAVVCQMAAA